MTDADFSKHNRHTVENLISQRDESLARIGKYDSELKELREKHAEELVTAKEQHAIELATIRAEVDGFQSDLKTERASLEVMAKELTEAVRRCDEMDAHPDVITAKKERRAAELKQKREELEASLKSVESEMEKG